jgi:hypothetical protein
MHEIQFEDLSTSDLVVDALYKGKEGGGLEHEVITNLISGVGNRGGFRKRGRGARPALCVLHSTLQHPDWPDRLYPELGRFDYYGDQKEAGKKLHDTHKGGNKVLRETFHNLHTNHRDLIPPFLIFTKSGLRRDVIFRGLAVPGTSALGESEDLLAQWKTASDERFQNYRAVFTILDCSVVSRGWIESVHPNSSESAPTVWRDWVDTGTYRELRAPRIQEHRKPEEQKPDSAKDEALLETLRSYFDDHPKGKYAFEPCAVKIVEIMDPNFTRIDLTRPWRDGGRDAVGSYRIGISRSGLEVDFALEAKCKRSGCGVTDTSRLVSRLRHRQFGIFVTTSWVSEQAYKELVEDRHPVLVISGRDIIEILRSGMSIRSGKDMLDWLSTVAPK